MHPKLTQMFEKSHHEPYCFSTHSDKHRFTQFKEGQGQPTGNSICLRGEVIKHTSGVSIILARQYCTVLQQHTDRPTQINSKFSHLKSWLCSSADGKSLLLLCVQFPYLCCTSNFLSFLVGYILIFCVKTHWAVREELGSLCVSHFSAFPIGDYQWYKYERVIHCYIP